MVAFDKTIWGDLSEAASREWLETNGIGGYACSTIAGMNTRRYHALLIAATRPPVGRMVLLSKLEETLVIGEERIELSTNQYGGAVHPSGFQLIAGFRLEPFPITTFKVNGVRLEKAVFMQQGSNTTVVHYRLLDAPVGDEVRLELRPLVAFRDHHALTHENADIQKDYEEERGLVRFTAYPGSPELFLAHNAKQVTREGYWYRNFFYAAEQERGLDFSEDLFNPFALHFDLSPDREASVIASTQPQSAEQAGAMRQAETERRARIARAAPVKDEFVIALTEAADQFLARRGEEWTVLAGFPWFTDWGRDTMISLPGLTLCTGRHDVARSILLNFARFVDQGMLPNRFPDSGGSLEYNTVDATLWYFEAVRAYVARTQDLGVVRDVLFPVLRSIVDWHVRGTRYSIKVEDGLLHAGEPGVQLTWMDAEIGDWVVTPRTGKPVEVQALWYNALKTLEELALRLGFAEDAETLRQLAEQTEESFNRIFWNVATGCLYDVVGEVADGAIRPNQIFAVSLHHSMLSPERAQQVVKVVERELLTPFGLRTLGPKDEHYCPRYGGDALSRDAAYHQGTVWPWLLGLYIRALMKVSGASEESRKVALGLVGPLKGHLTKAGLGQISEVFDGEAPQRPGGCMAQAWSVAELLRALCEDVYAVGAGGA